MVMGDDGDRNDASDAGDTDDAFKVILVSLMIAVSPGEVAKVKLKRQESKLMLFAPHSLTSFPVIVVPDVFDISISPVSIFVMQR
jgi:hypothetical protein